MRLVDTCSPRSEQARMMLLALAALVIMLPSAHTESGILAAPPSPFVPLALDRFLTTVDTTIPRHARVVVFTPRGSCLRATSLVHARALSSVTPTLRAPTCYPETSSRCTAFYAPPGAGAPRRASA